MHYTLKLARQYRIYWNYTTETSPPKTTETTIGPKANVIINAYPKKTTPWKVELFPIMHSQFALPRVHSMSISSIGDIIFPRIGALMGKANVLADNWDAQYQHHWIVLRYTRDAVVPQYRMQDNKMCTNKHCAVIWPHITTTPYEQPQVQLVKSAWSIKLSASRNAYVHSLTPWHSTTAKGTQLCSLLPEEAFQACNKYLNHGHAANL